MIYNIFFYSFKCDKDNNLFFRINMERKDKICMSLLFAVNIVLYIVNLSV